MSLGLEFELETEQLSILVFDQKYDDQFCIRSGTLPIQKS